MKTNIALLSFLGLGAMLTFFCTSGIAAKKIQPAELTGNFCHNGPFSVWVGVSKNVMWAASNALGWSSLIQNCSLSLVANPDGKTYTVQTESCGGVAKGAAMGVYDPTANTLTNFTFPLSGGGWNLRLNYVGRGASGCW